MRDATIRFFEGWWAPAPEPEPEEEDDLIRYLATIGYNAERTRGLVETGDDPLLSAGVDDSVETGDTGDSGDSGGSMDPVEDDMLLDQKRLRSAPEMTRLADSVFAIAEVPERILMADTGETLEVFFSKSLVHRSWRDAIKLILRTPALLKDKLSQFGIEDLHTHVTKHQENLEASTDKHQDRAWAYLYGKPQSYGGFLGRLGLTETEFRQAMDATEDEDSGLGLLLLMMDGSTGELEILAREFEDEDVEEIIRNLDLNEAGKASFRNEVKGLRDPLSRIQENIEDIGNKDILTLRRLANVLIKDRGDLVPIASLAASTGTAPDSVAGSRRLPETQEKSALINYCNNRMDLIVYGPSYISNNLSNRAFINTFHEMALEKSIEIPDTITEMDIVKWAIDSAKVIESNWGHNPNPLLMLNEGIDPPPEFFEYYQRLANDNHTKFIAVHKRTDPYGLNHFTERPRGAGNFRINWFNGWPIQVQEHARHLWGLVFSRHMAVDLDFKYIPHNKDARLEDKRFQKYKASVDNGGGAFGRATLGISADLDSLWDKAHESYIHHQKVILYFRKRGIYLDDILENTSELLAAPAPVAAAADESGEVRRLPCLPVMIDDYPGQLKQVIGILYNIIADHKGKSLSGIHWGGQHVRPWVEKGSDGGDHGSYRNPEGVTPHPPSHPPPGSGGLGYTDHDAVFDYSDLSADEDGSFGGGRHKPRKRKSKRKSKKKKSKKRKTKKISRKKYGGVLPYRDLTTRVISHSKQNEGHFITKPLPLKGNEGLYGYYDFVIKKDKQIIYLLKDDDTIHGHTSVLDSEESRQYDSDRQLRFDEPHRIINHPEDIVFIAGGISFENGLPIEITNSSGHYRMDDISFQRALMEINGLYDDIAFGKDIESLWEVVMDIERPMAMSVHGNAGGAVVDDALTFQAHEKRSMRDNLNTVRQEQAAKLAAEAAEAAEVAIRAQPTRLSLLGGVSLNNMKFLALNFPEQYGDGGNITLYDLLQETLGKRSMSDLNEADKTSLIAHLNERIAVNPDYYMPAPVVEMEEEDDEDGFGGGGRKSKRRKSKRRKKKRKTKKEIKP